VKAFDLSKYGLTVEITIHNAPAALLYEEAIRSEPGSAIADSGALIAYSGKKTGRAPLDKRAVRHPASEKDVWWEAGNLP